MIRTILLMLLCLARAGAADPAAPCSIKRAAFANPAVWVLCDDRQLFTSPDGGKNWHGSRLPGDARLRAIAFPGPRRGFIAGDSGTLLGTTDGGESWHPVPVPTTENLTSLFFAGKLGWITGWSGVILHSADGGDHWQKQQTGIQQGLESIYFADADHGWAAGWMGTILITADGGKAWKNVRAPGNLWSLDSVYFRDPTHGWVVGFGGQILHSADGGLTWQQQNSPVQSWLKSVVFDSSGRGWIASDNALLVSDDDGQHWNAVPVEGRVFLQQVLRVGDSLWAIGQFGIVKPAERAPGRPPRIPPSAKSAKG